MTDTLITQDGQTIPAPPNCQIHRVQDLFGNWKFFATPLPDGSGFPLWHDGRHWLLCSPFITAVFASACAKQEQADSRKKK